MCSVFGLAKLVKGRAFQQRPRLGSWSVLECAAGVHSPLMPVFEVIMAFCQTLSWQCQDGQKGCCS